MRRVLLIHGINSNGKWRDDVACVLRAHFDPIPIKYWHYRWFGATKLLLEPWALILLALLIYFVGARYLAAWMALALGLLVGIKLAMGPVPYGGNGPLRVWYDKRVHPYHSADRTSLLTVLEPF